LIDFVISIDVSLAGYSRNTSHGGAINVVQHFLLTNREILKDAAGNERIREDGKETASDLFRVAVWNGADFDLIKDTPPNEEVHFTDTINSDTNLDGFTGSKRLFYELYKTMAADDGGDVLLYIHGFNNDMSAVRGAMKSLIDLYASSSLSRVKQIIIFSWPAENDIRYRSDYRDAKTSGYALARATMKYVQFLNEFFAPISPPLDMQPLNKPCGNRLHLMCHSMGNFVLESMVSELLDMNLSRCLFNQVILTAADVDYDVFEDGQPFSHLPQYCMRTSVYFNNHDKAMFISATTKNPATRLGTNGPRIAARVPNNVVLVDATDVAPIGESLIEQIVGHSYHLNSPPVINDMTQVLAGIHAEEIEPRLYVPSKNAYRILRVPAPSAPAPAETELQPA
jgi:esterase/lipase superfamily enzyme